MAGLHGKNAELRISTGETSVGPVALTIHSDPTLSAAGVYEAPDKNLKFAAKGETGAPVFTYITGSTEKTIDSNSRFIHYAEGAIQIPPEDLGGLVPASVSGTYVSLEMETVGNITSEDRGYDLTVESDIVDTTTLNENFRTFVEGIQGWSGSLDGLYLNPERFKLAIADASGIIPRKILRMKPRPDRDTYLQGTVIFPTFNLSLSFDSAIERSIDFQGIGPIELVEDGLPFFPGL